MTRDPLAMRRNLKQGNPVVPEVSRRGLKTDRVNPNDSQCGDDDGSTSSDAMAKVAAAAQQWRRDGDASNSSSINSDTVVRAAGVM